MQRSCKGCPDIFIQALEALDISDPDLDAIDVSIVPMRHIDPMFVCPHTQMGLTTYCKASSCSWWVPFVQSANCLLAYVSKNSLDSLSVNEIAFILGESRCSVQSEMSLALRSLRSDTIDSEQAQDFVDPTYSPPSEGKCCVCGTRILFSGIEDDDLQYCGDVCYNTKPPTVIRIEMKFQCKVDRLIEKAMGVYSDIHAALQALGLPYSSYYKLASAN